MHFCRKWIRLNFIKITALKLSNYSPRSVQMHIPMEIYMSHRLKKGRSISVSAIQYTHVVVVLIILQINLDVINFVQNQFLKIKSYY